MAASRPEPAPPESTPGPSLKRKLFLPLMVGGIMLVEGVVIFVLVRMAPGDPVLINEFTVRADGRPVEAARAIFRGDRYAFAVEVFAAAAGSAGAAGIGFPNGGLESRFRQEVTP